MRLKDQIERALNVPVRVRAGAPGALDVYVDGQQIFSKKTAGRMPRADELIDRMRSKT